MGTEVITSQQNGIGFVFGKGLFGGEPQIPLWEWITVSLVFAAGLTYFYLLGRRSASHSMVVSLGMAVAWVGWVHLAERILR